MKIFLLHTFKMIIEDITEASEAPERAPVQNIENGQDFGTYSWYQTLTEIIIKIRIENEQAPDYFVTSESITVGDKLSGIFENSVYTTGVIQTIEDEKDQKYFVLYINKVIRNLWPNLFKGGPKLDPTLYQDMTINDLDTEEQIAVKRLLHDQRNKKEGLGQIPTVPETMPELEEDPQGPEKTLTFPETQQEIPEDMQDMIAKIKLANPLLFS
jgi:hypothetical protein